jgi:hypothetical protein
MSLTENPLNIEPAQGEFVAETDVLIDLLLQTLSHGNTFRFNASGRSMEPFIHSGDTVSIVQLLSSLPRLGDVLAFIHPLDGRLLLHRMIQKKGNEYLMKGDNLSDYSDGWVSAQQLLGKVSHIDRGDRKIWFGLGVEKRLIALLSRWNWLVPMLNRLRAFRLFFWN